MTSHELANKLLQAPDMPIHFSYEHGRTQLAPEITEIGQGIVSYCTYHCMCKVVEEDDAKEDECTQVILLS